MKWQFAILCAWKNGLAIGVQSWRCAREKTVHIVTLVDAANFCLCEFCFVHFRPRSPWNVPASMFYRLFSRHFTIMRRKKICRTKIFAGLGCLRNFCRSSLESVARGMPLARMRQLHVSHPVIYFGKCFLVAELSEFGLPLEADTTFVLTSQNPPRSKIMTDHGITWTVPPGTQKWLGCMLFAYRSEQSLGPAIPFLASDKGCHAKKWIWRTGT